MHADYLFVPPTVVWDKNAMPEILHALDEHYDIAAARLLPWQTAVTNAFVVGEDAIVRGFSRATRQQDEVGRNMDLFDNPYPPVAPIPLGLGSFPAPEEL